MTHLSGEERARYVQEMFARIAPRYDLMNRLMTAGQDGRWRQEVIRRAALDPGARLLDLGAGTGDLCFEALRQHPGCRPVAADFTLEMLRAGRKRSGGSVPAWTGADAVQLPFPANTFDAVVSGFLLRNVADLQGVLREGRRVLKPGGRWVSLDTTQPPENLLAPAIRLHLHRIIPAVGRWITGEADAYRYLPDSTAAFLRAEELAAHMAMAGFQQIEFHRRMFGTVAVHWGMKR